MNKPEPFDPSKYRWDQRNMTFDSWEEDIAFAFSKGYRLLRPDECVPCGYDPKTWDDKVFVIRPVAKGIRDEPEMDRSLQGSGRSVTDFGYPMFVEIER